LIEAAKSDRALPDAHLRDDETVAKMGLPAEVGVKQIPRGNDRKKGKDKCARVGRIAGTTSGNDLLASDEVV